MTLIGFATYGADRAEIITDTASYTRRVSSIGHCTKILTMPHLNAAVVSQGDNFFGIQAKSGAWQASGAVETFDELAESAQAWLLELRIRAIEEGETPHEDESTVFLIGYSETAGKFVAWGYASDDEFQPFKIPRPWIMPAPWMMRPSKLERERMQGWMAGHPDVDEAARVWATRPVRPAPRSNQEWIGLAIEAREQRSLSGGFANVIVAGDVFHTVLRRGSARTEKVYTFNDAGDELLRMVEHTEHPIALAAACWCDSGKSYGDCHAGEVPCGCRSGKPFGGCCQGRGMAQDFGTGSKR